ncbi:hypothetical protein [Gordonia amicalis]|uniref:hypothetical protein n=1 Tax=Gordonia amicalis TaxID=89053 RepID=UPI003A7F979F
MNENMKPSFEPDDDARRAEMLTHLSEAAEIAEQKDAVVDSREAAAVGRILDNLGLRRSTVDDELADESLADVVSSWTESDLVAHRGANAATQSISITSNGDLTTLFPDGVGTLAATVEVSSPEEGVSRVSAAIGIPTQPAGEVAAEIVVLGRAVPVRFPLRVVNRGSDRFPLLELLGAASLLERDLEGKQITEVRLRPDDASEDAED